MSPEEIAAMQAQLAAANQRVAELEPDAVVGKSHREAETKKLDAALARLPADQRALIDAQSSIDMKGKLLAQFNAARVPPTPGAPGGPPPPALDFATAWKDPAKWAELKRRDPDGAAKWVAAQRAGPGTATKPLQFL